MLDVALVFLVKTLNEHLATRLPPPEAAKFGEVQLTRLVDDSGKLAVEQDRIGAALINVEEERVVKSHLPEPRYFNGRQVLLPPPLRLNLQVLFAANFKQYDHALRYLSQVMTFFQAHSRFESDEYPGLDPRIEQLSVELQSLSYEQLNQVWAFVGGKQLPSAIYTLRLVTLQDVEPTSIGEPITRIDTTVHTR